MSHSDIAEKVKGEGRDKLAKRKLYFDMGVVPVAKPVKLTPKQRKKRPKGLPKTLFGFPIVVDPSMPALKDGDIAFGKPAKKVYRKGRKPQEPKRRARGS